MSANRLITALALGLPTAADNLESYKEFSEFYVDIRSEKFRAVMRDPNTGMKHAGADPRREAYALAW